MCRQAATGTGYDGMAASTRVPASSSRKQGTAHKRPSTRSWLPNLGLSSLARRMSGLRLRMPSLVMTDRFRREAGGVALILAALFSAWALGRGATDGPIAEWWGSALRGLFGYAAGLMPVLIALTAIRALRDQEGPVILLRHYLGAAGYLIAATRHHPSRRDGIPRAPWRRAGTDSWRSRGERPRAIRLRHPAHRSWLDQRLPAGSSGCSHPRSRGSRALAKATGRYARSNCGP